MSKASVEDIKLESHGLRGQIAEEFADPALSHISDESNVLLKHHGSYQQDNRDLRAQLSKEKKDKAWSFMIRSKMPGGRVTAKQWLIHDDLCTKAFGNVRLTNRQGIQLHGVLKGGLKEVIHNVCHSGLSTMGACGDVVRNTMGPAAPVKDAVHADTQKLTEEISQRFLWRSQAYADIWLDGEKLEPDWIKDPEVNPAVREATKAPEGDDPIYGKVYLPRKFKIGVAIQPCNDVDVFSQDVGLVPHVVNGEVEGYTITVGGGFGMSHGQLTTRPFLGQPLLYAKRANVVDAVEAVVTTQRDHGNRTERKNARLKYTVQSMGLDGFRAEVVRRLPGIETLPPKELHFDTVEDNLGWHEQGDGKLYCCVHVSMGRIVDRENGPQYRSCFAEIARTLDLPFIVTPNTNLIIAEVKPEQKAAVDAILAKHGVVHADEAGFTRARKVAHACVALPTCGLALSESERVLPGFMDKIDESLRQLGLADEPILFRMTGCPNGCGRPYNADFGFVGRAPNKYAMFVGGSIRGDRLAGLEFKSLTGDEIPVKVRAILEEFKAGRNEGEIFADWFSRTRTTGEAPTPEQFHIELAERAAKLAGEKVAEAG
ncbi:MAG: NADPH-dependent assimilatory sulfite reductase hemoprotein subunit [Prosthecobacter sp.]|uniref:NADPH-dependent assimilatory sulfite reductase hemoprotein subunit n=1 Tax=Prosthecobacter sp. TaxID=1965333 RepID=UPI0019F8A71E|nr:NADPH-dependent assimilatory sulfite reductase hemoprotein subunit [Prosthecobacter sp.]MBE2286505.1 NADPH-dependent assimilatory sulfite reductase hemoprotein subunit [Prosthecobacter sp.]